MPLWIPGRLLIGYLTGAFLLVAGASFLLARKTRMAAIYLGTGLCSWSCSSMGRSCSFRWPTQATAVQVEGINYFADTLLFAGAILALAQRHPHAGISFVTDWQAAF